MENDVLFREVQGFGNPFLISLVLVGAAVMIGVWGFALYRVVVQHKAFGNLSPAVTKALAFPLLSLALLLPIGLLSLSLTTEVRADGLYVQLFPLHWSFQKIDLTGLEDHEIRTYDPIREYGGWGLRQGPSGRAYNLGGDQGLQLRFADRTPILVGTAEPSALSAAFDQLVAAQ